MRTYIRDKTKGGTYFLTINLLNRKSQLLTNHINEFRQAYRLTKHNHDFELDAMILLPDHVHIITLVEDSDNYAVIIASIKTHFSLQIKKSNNEIINHSRSKKRERGIWQRRF